MPALPPYIIEPIWQQFEALLRERRTDHPLGCHRSRIPERVIFEKLPALAGRVVTTTPRYGRPPASGKWAWS